MKKKERAQCIKSLRTPNILFTENQSGRPLSQELNSNEVQQRKKKLNK